MTSSIELSFKTDIPKEILVELRDFFRQEIPGIDFYIPETPILPGRMGSIPWTEMLIHAAVVSTSEVLFLSVLETAGENLAHKIKAARDKFMREKNLRTLDISGSVKAGDKRTSFKITDEPDVQYFDGVSYSIDPEHTYVLLVGCGSYTSNEIPAIPPVEQNLKALYELIIDKQYFAIPPENVTVSLNETDSVIRRLLHQTSRRSGMETFLFYYVGHGFCTANDKYYLAASNTEKENDFINSGIEKDFIKEDILSRSPAKQKVAIVDACYSGLLTMGNGAGLFDREITGSYILTSSSADEVSFYDKIGPYTFFTGALVNALKNGLRTDTETISLDDLYQETVAEMKKKKLQQPMYKNGLNIAPANFIVAHNAAYSVETEIAKLNVLTTAGKYREAELMVQKLIQKFPADTSLREMAVQIGNDRLYSEFVHSGDNYFHSLKDYRKAAECYQQAYELKKDVAVRSKLQQSLAYQKEQPTTPAQKPGEQLHTPKQENVKNVPTPHVPEKQPEQPIPLKKGILKRIPLLLAVFGAVAIGFGIEYAREAKEEIPVTSLTDSTSIAMSAPAPADTTKPLQSKTKSKEPKDQINTEKTDPEVISSSSTVPNKPQTNNSTTPDGQIESDLKNADNAYYKDDYSLAANLYIKNKQFLDGEQMYHIGWLYQHGKGIGMDNTEAMNWYQKAVDKGSVNATYFIGDMYNSGHNYSEAMKWFLKSADNKDYHAMVRIGILYEYGSGVAQDYNAAMNWYLKAANQGITSGMINVGSLYEKGRGVTQDYDEARKWYQKAADAGDGYAKQALEKIKLK